MAEVTNEQIIDAFKQKIVSSTEDVIVSYEHNALAVKMPSLTMSYVEVADMIAAFAVAKYLQKDGTPQSKLIAWPATVKAQNITISFKISAAYHGSLYAIVIIQGESSNKELVDAVIEELRAWNTSAEAKKLAAGPLASILNDYFDFVQLLNDDVLVEDTDHRLVCAGRFAGLDIWGRALVIDTAGTEHAFEPHRYFLKA